MPTTAIQNYSIHPTGISIDYFKEEIQETFVMRPLGACFVLKQIGYIRSYRIKSNNLFVSLNVTEDIVTPEGGFETVLAGKIEVTWDYFVRNYDIDEVWAKEAVMVRLMHDRIFRPIG